MKLTLRTPLGSFSIDVDDNCFFSSAAAVDSLYLSPINSVVMALIQAPDSAAERRVEGITAVAVGVCGTATASWRRNGALVAFAAAAAAVNLELPLPLTSVAVDRIQLLPEGLRAMRAAVATEGVK